MKTSLYPLLLIGFILSATPAAARQPNVVLIMTDDQGYGDVASHGNPWIDTPVHDRIAAEGARFHRFFVSPVCAPTRASLLTGRYHLRTGVHGVTRGWETMRASERTLAEIFKDAGYATGAFGKWHNGAHYPNHPNGQGFDEFFGFCAGHWNNYFNTTVEHNGAVVPYEGFIIDAFTNKAIDFIKQNKDQPFLCYLPLNTPHTPWQVPGRYYDKYAAMDIPTQEAATAYAMVENIDDNMGRVLQTLDDLGLDNDTIVVFLTDNGANSDRYNAGMKGRKGSLHEGGTRVPLFIRWPGHIKPGQIFDRPTAHIDILPTLAELAGIELPKTPRLDGRSLAPYITLRVNDPARPEWKFRTLFTHWGDKNGAPDPSRGAARAPRFRAVKYNNTWELYDLIDDPRQLTDLAQQNPEQLEKMVTRYDKWFASVTAKGFAPIPTHVGHKQHPTVTLPGHEATLMGPAEEWQGKFKRVAGISYVGSSGWANDWITHWTDTQAYPAWDINVTHPGAYNVKLHYVCTQANLGAKLRVHVSGDAVASVEGQITRAHNPEVLHSPDRIRRGEVYEKTWATLDLGTIQLQKGFATLAVKALTKPGAQVMDLKDVQLSRMD